MADTRTLVRVAGLRRSMKPTSSTYLLPTTHSTTPVRQVVPSVVHLLPGASVEGEDPCPPWKHSSMEALFSLSRRGRPPAEPACGLP
jgi:hypothetical protein